MHLPRRFLPFVALALLTGGLSAAAHEGHDKDNATKNAPTAAQRAGYPLKTCVVTDDDLDEMGHPVAYTYKEDGKPDRVVLFCCKDCIDDFKKDPATYLKKLDEASAKKTPVKP